jgi:RimJ/RimL family protein N-acetyltransferase
MAVTIRQIREADIPAFHRVLDAVAREKRYLATMRAPSLDKTRKFVEGNIARGCAQYVAEVDGELVGWADILPGNRDSTQHMGGLGMGIVDGHRRRGIGRQLLQAAIDHCWRQGLVRIELEVFTNNAPAIGLYEALGFQYEGRLRKARLLDGEYRDVFHMALLHPDIDDG